MNNDAPLVSGEKLWKYERNEIGDYVVYFGNGLWVSVARENQAKILVHEHNASLALPKQEEREKL